MGHSTFQGPGLGFGLSTGKSQTQYDPCQVQIIGQVTHEGYGHPVQFGQDQSDLL